jgi:hypothetical protein
MGIIRVHSFIFILFFSFFGCKKKNTTNEEPPATVNTELLSGLPENAKSINGYFYISQTVINSFYNFNGYAIFNDPSRDLINSFDHISETGGNQGGFGIGNVSVGNVSFNNFTFNKSNFGNRINYQNTAFIRDSILFLPARWKTEGNGSFKGFETGLTRGFPVVVNTLTNTAQSTSLSISAGYTVNIPALASNFDSVIVSFNYYSLISPVGVRKRVSKGVTSVYFSSSELSTIPNSSNYFFKLGIYAFNYSNKTIDNVTHVFELSSKTQFDIRAFP